MLSVISSRAPESSNHRALISLHVRLKAALAKAEAASGMYEHYVRTALRQQDLLSGEVFERSRSKGSPLEKNPVKPSKPGRAYRFRPGVAGV